MNDNKVEQFEHEEMPKAIGDAMTKIADIVEASLFDFMESIKGVDTETDAAIECYVAYAVLCPLIRFQTVGKDAKTSKHWKQFLSESTDEIFNDIEFVPSSGLTFGMAIEALKVGKKVARAGWNGKGMWLSLSGDGDREVPARMFWSENNAKFAEENGGTATVLPCITMKTTNAHGRVAILMGWLASQTDMLSDDWVIVE